jgi:hypothetical protein
MEAISLQEQSRGDLQGQRTRRPLGVSHLPSAARERRAEEGCEHVSDAGTAIIDIPRSHTAYATRSQ